MDCGRCGSHRGDECLNPRAFTRVLAEWFFLTTLLTNVSQKNCREILLTLGLHLSLRNRRRYKFIEASIPIVMRAKSFSNTADRNVRGVLICTSMYG